MKRLIIGLTVCALAGSGAFAKGQKRNEAGAEGPQSAGSLGENKKVMSGGAKDVWPRIEKAEKDTVRFLDENGHVKMEMKLRKNTHRGRVPKKYGWINAPDAEVRIIDEETAHPSPDGKYMAIIHEDAISGNELYEGGRSLRIYDANTGEVVFRRDDFSGYEVDFSENGERIFFGIKNTERPSGFEAPDYDCLFMT